MKNNSLPLILLATAIALLSCKKNLTSYYGDAEKDGLSIFSNHGNNLLTCYADGAPWRTKNRISGALVPTSYELRLRIAPVNTLRSEIVFSWAGNFLSENDTYNRTLELHLYVPPGFNYRDISDRFFDKRIIVDTAVGYFSSTLKSSVPYTQGIRGTGSVYFNRANMDSTASGIKGKLAGLLSATFQSYTITDGRFDHDLDAGIFEY